jgi:hypothetical protein
MTKKQTANYIDSLDKIEKLSIEPKLIEQAVKLSEQQEELDNSYRGNDANFIGTLGELVAEEWFLRESISVFPDKSTTHDYRLKLDNRTIDVKTKDRTVGPKLEFDCSIPLYNHEKQIPDYYLFVSLQRDRRHDPKDPFRFHTAYVLGAATQHLMHTRGKVWKRNQVDESNGTKFWTDCLNVSIRDLRTLKDFSISLKSVNFEVSAFTHRYLEGLKSQGQSIVCSTGFQESLRRK